MGVCHRLNGGGRGVAATYPEVALVRVKDKRLLHVELALHFQSQAADGGLEVGLLSVHHQPHTHLRGFLRGQERKRGFVWGSGETGSHPYTHTCPGTSQAHDLGQNAHPLQQPHHLLLLLLSEPQQQRLQLSCLKGEHAIRPQQGPRPSSL